MTVYVSNVKSECVVCWIETRECDIGECDIRTSGEL